MKQDIDLSTFFDGLTYIQQVKTKSKQSQVELINQKDFLEKLIKSKIVNQDFLYSNEIGTNKLIAETFGKLYGLDSKFSDLFIMKKIQKSI